MLASPPSHALSSYPFHRQYSSEQLPSSTATSRRSLATAYPVSLSVPTNRSYQQSHVVPANSTAHQHITADFDAGHQFMSTPVFSTQTPPIRVHHSSPAPPLSETALSQHEWQSGHGGNQMWAGTGAYRQSGEKHQRTSSGSSIGSGGPSSPYNATTSHPHIVPPEASPAGLQAFPPYDFADPADATAFSKSYDDQQDSFLAPAFQNFDPATQDSESNVAAKLAMMQALKFSQRSSDSPAPTDFSASNPHSVSSRGQNSPKSTQSNMPNGFQYQNHGLYNTSSYSQAGQTVSQPASSNAMLSPYRNVFNERIQAANNSHMNAGPHSPVSSISRDRSPFRQGSPFAAPIDTFGPASAHLGSAAQIRERQKVEEDAMALRQHQYRPEEEMTPKTISPKDAVLEFHESEEDAKMPLFPDESMDRAFEGLSTFRRQSSNFNFTPASIPGQVQVPQQYPFISQQRRQHSSFQSRAEGTPEFPSHLTSMDSSASESNNESAATEISKPAQTSADSGTYTCTYHGCTLRFETPAKLQKHKREGHRQSTPSQAATAGSGMSPAVLLRNSQAGPHKCDRINPQTGKPCNTIFSRPYDLTRHEDTIHNARKRKVRCQYCTEDKTFSRNDALTRHMRVVHPEIEFSGKSKKHED